MAWAIKICFDLMSPKVTELLWLFEKKRERSYVGFEPGSLDSLQYKNYYMAWAQFTKSDWIVIITCTKVLLARAKFVWGSRNYNTNF